MFTFHVIMMTEAKVTWMTRVVRVMFMMREWNTGSGFVCLEEFWQSCQLSLPQQASPPSSRVSWHAWEDDLTWRRVCCKSDRQTSSLQCELSCVETTHHFSQIFCHNQRRDSWTVSHLQKRNIKIKTTLSLSTLTSMNSVVGLEMGEFVVWFITSRVGAAEGLLSLLAGRTLAAGLVEEEELLVRSSVKDICSGRHFW